MNRAIQSCESSQGKRMSPRTRLNCVLLAFVPAALCGLTNYVQVAKNRQIEVDPAHDAVGNNAIAFPPFLQIDNSTLDKWMSAVHKARQSDDSKQANPVQNATNQECGIAGTSWKAAQSPNDAKIVGGVEAAPHQFPWQVLITSPNMKFVCGGSIIYDDWIVTSAGCANVSQEILVLMGMHNRTDGPKELRISQNITIHPEWNRKAVTNNIALIQLPEPVIFSEYIRPICLPQRGTYDDLINDAVTLTGWGDTEFSLNYSDVLRALNTTVIDNVDCGDSFDLYLPETIICSDGSTRQGTCWGDNGGPMNYYDQNTGKWTLVGVASFRSYWSCYWDYPSGFTRVSSYLDWIQETTGRNETLPTLSPSPSPSPTAPAPNGSSKLRLAQSILLLSFISCFKKLIYF